MADSANSDQFVSSPMRDNWYQRSSYLGSTFALITTVDEHGQTNIGPYQLSFPFEVNTGRSWMVISRNTSNTATNVHRTLKCALNFIEYDEAHIDTILKLGYPGQTTAEKMAYNTLDLIESPTAGRESNSVYPKILADAYQVYECTLDVDRINENPILRDSPSAHLLLNIDNILVKEKWMGGIDGSGEKMPRIPMTYGFRGGSSFWFGEVQTAYKLPIPDLGAKHELVHYEANRLDDEVRFTMDACKQLTGIPNAFLRNVLGGIIKQAKARGVTNIDEAFVLELNKEREA
ncbi:MAG: flavin reductase (DIM6/NTAB) family NADH-FMN oxidoreductase RutF [Gammaproteobacteria bacterium]|jgi:flavin reductase (DIM6/NTAB) family NADH-FMN oxidoreductase RutF